MLRGKRETHALQYVLFCIACFTTKNLFEVATARQGPKFREGNFPATTAFNFEQDLGEEKPLPELDLPYHDYEHYVPLITRGQIYVVFLTLCVQALIKNLS